MHVADAEDVQSISQTYKLITNETLSVPMPCWPMLADAMLETLVLILTLKQWAWARTVHTAWNLR